MPSAYWKSFASIAFAPIVPGMISADAKLKAINMLGNYLGLWLGEGDKPAGAGGNVSEHPDFQHRQGAPVTPNWPLADRLQAIYVRRGFARRCGSPASSRKSDSRPFLQIAESSPPW